MNDLDLNNYTIYTLRDCNNSNLLYGAIMLHNKHTIEDFQKEINRIKEKKAEEIYTYGDDWDIISSNIDERFDWIELSISDDYLVY